MLEPDTHGRFLFLCPEVGVIAFHSAVSIHLGSSVSFSIVIIEELNFLLKRKENSEQTGMYPNLE